MSVVLLNDGTVQATGSSAYYANGSASDTTTWATIGGSYLTNVTKIRGLGGSYGATVFALRSDGKMVVWGNCETGVNGIGNNADQVSPPYVMLNKTIIDFQVTGLSYGGNGDVALFMLCSDGTVYHTGQGSYGQGASSQNYNNWTPQQIIF